MLYSPDTLRVILTGFVSKVSNTTSEFMLSSPTDLA